MCCYKLQNWIITAQESRLFSFQMMLIYVKVGYICVDHFDPKFIKQGKRCKLLWKLSPIPTIQTDIVSTRSILRTPAFPCKLPTARCHGKDELAEFQASDKISNLNSLTSKHCPNGFTFTRHNDTVIYYKLCIGETTNIPSVTDSITIDESIHVSLAYQWYHVPLPQWFRSGHNY